MNEHTKGTRQCPFFAGEALFSVTDIYCSMKRYWRVFIILIFNFLLIGGQIEARVLGEFISTSE